MFHPRPVTLLSSSVIAMMGAFFLSGLATLDMGSARNMGPGYLPVILGGLLVFLAVGLLASEGCAPPEEDESTERFALRPFVAILTSVLTFAVTVSPFGLLPAVASSTLIASVADRKTTLTSAIGTCLVVTFLCWVVFIVGLALPVQAFRI